jgi:hypothetical protein
MLSGPANDREQNANIQQRAAHVMNRLLCIPSIASPISYEKGFFPDQYYRPATTGLSSGSRRKKKSEIRYPAGKPAPELI